jgi:hypothetical protein
MGIFSKKGLGQEKWEKEPNVQKEEKSGKESKAPKEPKPKPKKPTFKVKNDPSKGASFWVVEIKDGVETILFSGTIGDCRDYIYLVSKNLIL